MKLLVENDELSTILVSQLTISQIVVELTEVSGINLSCHLDPLEQYLVFFSSSCTLIKLLPDHKYRFYRLISLHAAARMPCMDTEREGAICWLLQFCDMHVQNYKARKKNKSDLRKEILFFALMLMRMIMIVMMVMRKIQNIYHIKPGKNILRKIPPSPSFSVEKVAEVSTCGKNACLFQHCVKGQEHF